MDIEDHRAGLSRDEIGWTKRMAGREDDPAALPEP